MVEVGGAMAAKAEAALALGDPWPTLTFCKSLLHYEEVFGKEFVLNELVFDILVDLFLS